MKTSEKIFWGSLIVMMAILAGRFVYNNVIAPWPYRHELRSCLDLARALSSAGEISEAENACFRTYPHVN